MLKIWWQHAKTSERCTRDKEATELNPAWFNKCLKGKCWEEDVRETWRRVVGLSQREGSVEDWELSQTWRF